MQTIENTALLLPQKSSTDMESPSGCIKCCLTNREKIDRCFSQGCFQRQLEKDGRTILDA